MRGFRAKLLLALMLAVAGVAALVLYIAERNLAGGVERDMLRAFEGEISAWNDVQRLRHAALMERCRALVRKSRIHAALEDDALDLLYPTAVDELRDIMAPGSTGIGVAGEVPLRAEFFRFLDPAGRVIPPPASTIAAIGRLEPEEVSQLSPDEAPRSQQIGYIRRSGRAGGALSELIAVPIVSMESGLVIAALVLGFDPIEPDLARSDTAIKRGIWLGGRLYLTSGDESAADTLSSRVEGALASTDGSRRARIEMAGTEYLVFHKRLNPDSPYPPAHEVGLYPLTGFLEERGRLRVRILSAGGLVLLAGLMVSHLVASRLSRPVEQLAVDSEANLLERKRVEAELATTGEELQRAARFSADASHQLMTPVTVLRAGLEELLTQKNISPREAEEISGLIHQTYRLSNIIKDLLLLSRMDAGRLQIEFSSVDLSHLIESAIDDLSALPEGFGFELETDVPAGLSVSGEKGYISLILQNLLENARRYNRPAGAIRIAARTEGNEIAVNIANTGKPIPQAVREHIFERFHRGAVGENVPGYGLGLNLARQLARLHRGDVRLVRSDDGWTEFEARFQAVEAAMPGRRVPA